MQQSLVKIITELQAISQNGLTFCKDEFDRERYNRLRTITAELASLHSNKSQTEVTEIFAQDVGYTTPKVAVRAAIFENNQILLVRERADDLWALPGGWADVNYSLTENMVKEVREETGFECTVNKLLFISDKRKSASLSKWPHIYELHFLCSITGGTARPTTIETNGLGFFTENNIPPLSINRTNNKQLQQCFEYYKSPKLPTIID